MAYALLCEGASKSSEEWTARRDSAGRLLCERCSRQLTKVKHHRACGPGHACHPRCKPFKRGVSVLDPDADAPAAAAVAAPQPKKRRTASDPGEQLSQSRTQAITRRIALPAPSTQKKHQRATYQDDKIGQQLKEAHARRMAALVAAPSATAVSAHQR
jgi:hypothetical protein